ncbi:MAG: o-succinylbenzoate--CoA ligase [Chloroflexaceae bacterium]|jgi:O-succinylbenzoic acid--CoA ligase|nr:o-succinylbenzoate--CoA ligase [Chloroflexaceae bacterium]
MQDWLSAQARARPQALALVLGDVALSYDELNRQVAMFAARLSALGLRPGAHVGLLLPNRLEAVLAIHAAARLGCVLVLFNTRLTARELDGLLHTTPCELLLYSQETAGVACELRESPRLVCVDESEAPDFLAFNSSAPLAEATYLHGTIDLDAVCAILFTSGTSGNPKGVQLTYGNFFAGAMSSAYRIGVLPHDRWLCVLPLYHVGGLSIVLRSCLYGTAVDLWTHFDPNAINAALARTPITLLSLVPTMLYRMLETAEALAQPLALRLVLLGGAAATPELVAHAQACGMPVTTTYGLTEAASQVATALPADTMRKPGSVGKALLFSQLRVLDEAGCDQPPGAIGEIVVHGPTVMAGYHADAAATGRALRDGWLYTGDLGYLDDEGDLWVVQRRSDLIISGGENVYPAEVEAVLLRHPAVAEAAVVGVASPEWGQQVAAALVLREGDANVESILAFCRAQLAGYKQPRLVRVVPQLPRTASGKIQRTALQELFRDGA